jgi:hypothetical protein
MDFSKSKGLTLNSYIVYYEMPYFGLSLITGWTTFFIKTCPLYDEDAVDGTTRTETFLASKSSMVVHFPSVKMVRAL